MNDGDSNPNDEKRRRILAAARELIQETGDFDMPMRALAARTQLSLRTPYEFFGSKAGVIGAILAEDQARFRDAIATHHSVDVLENIFDRVRWGMDFYAHNEPFYRALFRATQAYSAGHTEEPTREVVRSFRILSARAQRAGLIRREIDAAHLGDILTDVWAANLRMWALEDADIKLVGAKISFGFAAVLAGVATGPATARMRAHIAEFQRVIQGFGPPSPTGPPVIPPGRSRAA